MHALGFLYESHLYVTIDGSFIFCPLNRMVRLPNDIFGMPNDFPDALETMPSEGIVVELTYKYRRSQGTFLRPIICATSPTRPRYEECSNVNIVGQKCIVYI